MPIEEPPRPRARIAEARRNRAALLVAASRLFASGSGPVPLEAVAREAGVGIGTLYRHFPTRDDLVEAVYTVEIRRLDGEAAALLEHLAPLAAFQAWTLVFSDWAITKHGMTDALGRIIATGRLDRSRMRGQLIEIVQRFVDAGRPAGQIRSDVSATDIAALLAGVLAASGGALDVEQTERLLGLVVDAVRPGIG